MFMQILNIINQIRRDFTARLVCQSCKHEQILNSGYDDDYFHQKVIPDIKCEKCGESTNSLNLPVEPFQTKYPAGMII
jgi:hypothetical protein